MNDPKQGNRPPRLPGYYEFAMALAAGTMIGAIGLVLLEYLGVINFVKNWP